MNTLTVGFIGLGLIGGSIAKVLKKNRPDIYTIAYNRSEAPRKQALADGVIDTATGEIDESFLECDFIFLCTPVEYNSEYLRKLIPFIKKRLHSNRCRKRQRIYTSHCGGARS